MSSEAPEAFQTISCRIERGRARIALNRPDKRNAISVLMQQELERALWEIGRAHV